MVRRPSGRRRRHDEAQATEVELIDGQTEFGAAWKKTSRENREYLSVKLDDPSFPAPIFANLVEADEGYSLIWSRRGAAD